MALSVLKRPQGFINNPSGSTGIYSNGSSVITKIAHGLHVGNTIYITANQAIGFWYVTPITVDTFNIREYAGATVYTFVGSGTFTYYPHTTGFTAVGGTIDIPGHNWSAVHLPIVYKLQSTLWPTNSVDTTRTVTSYSNDNGFVKLTCSGVIEANITELEFIKVTFTGGTSAIYQVISWYSSSIVTINLAYIGGITFVGVQYYYNSYHARVRIYAGLQSTHFFASQNPIALVTELKLIPDSNGIITVNINEYIKNSINIIKNDLLKGTLQNNLDAFCQFYITYAEGYDYSAGGYSLLDYVGSYTDDSTTFVGYAVNAQLPFKNVYSGFMSEYVYGSTTTKLKFLTPSLYPTLTPGQFFDISFINQIGARLRMKREAYVNGVVRNLFFDDINDYGVGIYRYEVAQSIYLEDRIDLTLQWQDYTGYINISEVKTISVNSDCYTSVLNLTWLNSTGGFDYWAFKSDSDYGASIEGTTKSEVNILNQWPNSFGEGADSITFETSRTSRQTIKVRAENISMDQVNDLYRIRLSPIVQIVSSRTNRTTVIVDNSSFVYLKQNDKLFNLSFNISLTNNLPSQSL